MLLHQMMSKRFDRDVVMNELIAEYDQARDLGEKVVINMPLASFEFWMEDGCYLKLADMDSAHIQRCIGKIFRSPIGWRASYLPYLQAELDRRQG